DLDQQGQSQTKITKWVTFDTPSEGQGSAVAERSATNVLPVVPAARAVGARRTLPTALETRRGAMKERARAADFSS
ncbi:hypothetical protein, partial [Streptomyces sp. NPDC056337]|uniref:hypothetical protein n=1 Tax=Streptomyces sp. NPDC056337 TaxID=3345787 RepID=UPI0035DC91B0